MKNIGVIGSFVAVGILAVLLLTVDREGWLAGPRGWIEKGVVGIKSPIFGLKELVVSIQDLGSDRAKVRSWLAAQAQIASLQGQVVGLTLENKTLQDQLGLQVKPAGKLHMAEPIGLTGGLMTINVGTADGVGVGDAVVYGANLVGRVVSASVEESEVRLPVFENENISVAVRENVTGIKKASGEVIGQNGDLILNKVGLTEPLSVGDLVMTVGQGYQRDLVIGKVAEIMVQESNLFKMARIEPAVDYGALERVFVVEGQ